ncbi:hypothetical protein DRF59_12910 [Chryseobacterium flavum]|uniref:Lipoprotein n=1 Tax=Chryseobacterium flavum TaxID=415851 RepID=A0A3D9CKS1_9FLAO|nr:hypothetical protein [Chryseobacterium flavum]REC66366.1 hypothetical protein DRF59_12910 [Chryseobacterium flavum]
MKKYLSFLILLFFVSCNPLLKQYKVLETDNYRKEISHKKFTALKSILNKSERKPILIVSWDKSMLATENLKGIALLYNPGTKEKKIFKINISDVTTLEEINSVQLNTREYKEFLYILDEYLKGNEEYLLQLRDSFSSSEVSMPFYLYDFLKNKKLKISSFVLNENRKAIQ